MRVPPRLMSIARLPIPALVSLVILVFAVYLILTRDQQIAATNFCPPENPVTVEYYARLEFPESMDNLWADCASPALEEAMVRVRFDMDARDFDSLLNAMLLDTTRTEVGEGLQYIEIPPDNRPFSALSGYYYSLTENSAFSATQELLIDRSNSERYTIYLVIVNHLPQLEIEP